MANNYTDDYLLDRKIKILQPLSGYRASGDAVLLSAMPDNKLHNAKILDVGSGTGAVSLCLAHRLQKNNVQIFGFELQKELTDLSNKSAAANEFDFLHFYQADIRKKIELPVYSPCSFDVVVSNPPYSEHDMPSPNISKATAHNHQNFDLEQWLAFCLKSLKPFGKLYIINRAEALPNICSFLQNKAGGIIILPIYSKQGQYAKRVIISAQKDSKSPCKILPPITMHDSDGKYTESSEKILRKGLSFNDLTNI
ncbi:MAG: methyltransferase domain-containing protein [Alphaproteobacteria bacterium]|nr:methyltransferase domain-containing protein [Alphaproteobacteria bacterium]